MSPDYFKKFAFSLFWSVCFVALIVKERIDPADPAQPGIILFTALVLTSLIAVMVKLLQPVITPRLPRFALWWKRFQDEPMGVAAATQLSALLVLAMVSAATFVILMVNLVLLLVDLAQQAL